MKRTSIALFVASLGLFLLSLANLSPGVSAQLPMPKDDGGGGSDPTGAPATPVEVTNALTGTMAVKNFPLRQEVFGTVNVGNLPVDGDGNLRIAPAPIHGMIPLTSGAIIDQDNPSISIAFLDVSQWRDYNIAVQTTLLSEFPNNECPTDNATVDCHIRSTFLGPPDIAGSSTSYAYKSPTDPQTKRKTVAGNVATPGMEITFFCRASELLVNEDGGCFASPGPFEVQVNYLNLFLTR